MLVVLAASLAWTAAAFTEQRAIDSGKSVMTVRVYNLKQTQFGMKPVKVAGRAIKVKDEVRIEFDIQLVR
ncbi:MAG: hypothetical protein ACJ74Z_14245 [Bryobacteraceae bacterium]